MYCNKACLQAWTQHATSHLPADRAGCRRLAISIPALPPSLPGQVVDIAGQRGCLILDLAEDKQGQLKSLPGLLLGGEKGGCECCRHEVCLRRSTDAVRQPAWLLRGGSMRKKEAECRGTCGARPAFPTAIVAS